MPSESKVPLLSGVLRSRFAYVWTIRALQLCLILLAGVTAFQLRFEFSISRGMKPALYTAVCLWSLCKVPVFHAFGLGRGVWRYFGPSDVVRVAAANVSGSALASIVILGVAPQPFPRSVLVIDLLLTLLLSVGVRIGTRQLLEAKSRTGGGEQRRALIYGAGTAGALLLNEARSSGRLRHHICGFVDDNRDKWRMLVSGVPVWGGGEDLPELVETHRIGEVLIALPSATGAQMSRVIEHCHRAGVTFRTVPALSEIIANRGAVAQVRDVAVEDVLGRSAVELEQSRIDTRLRGRVALISGAAGSIGSELCRQIARFEPAALVAVDISETGLFHLEQELRQRFPKLAIHPEIGNIQNRQRLCDVFGRHAPTVVYHAAAYKHVPLMESHAFEAVENNVLGTYNLATVAAEFGVEDFVMISSDKAVHPTNIMGATKRVAELVVRSLQNGGPRFVSVRFGNVLGSNGSVVPIFKKQIASGGPVTVTHPEMRRYFMTIPEAAQLVLQASVMGSGGEIFVLDMGEPVRIADLARKLIFLSGLKPDQDIQIEYTGVRPGEKLFEELKLADEQTIPTYHEKIKVFAGRSMPFEEAIHQLATLRKACESRDLRTLLFALKEIVPDYNPSSNLLHQIVDPSLHRLCTAVSAEAAPARPTDIDVHAWMPGQTLELQ